MNALTRVPRTLITVGLVTATLAVTLASASAANAGRRADGMDECMQSAEGNSCSGGPFEGGGATGVTTGQPDGNTGWAPDGPGGSGGGSSGTTGGSTTGGGATPVAVNNASTVVPDPSFKGDTLYAIYANGKKDWLLRQTGINPGTGEVYFEANIGSGATQIPSIGETIPIVSRSAAVPFTCYNAGPRNLVCH